MFYFLLLCMVLVQAKKDVYISNDLFTRKPDLDAIAPFSEGKTWTLIQRRVDGKIDFYRNWKDYEDGFGDFQRDFWIGLRSLHLLTRKGSELLIVMMKVDGTVKYAKYSQFQIDTASTKYKLSISGYSGNAGNDMQFHNGQSFSTRDNDNDPQDKEDCANRFKGAWWYKTCHRSNLNGLYLQGKHSSYADGVNWKSFTTYHESLKEVRMLISV